jgi:hypothetical protein
VSLERRLVLGAALLYAVSLALPAIEGQGFPDQTGFDVLRQGAGAWRSGILAWYANPALWVSVVLLWFGRWRLGLAASLAGLLLALSSFAAAGTAERAGRSVPDHAFAAGFYVWLAAFAIVVIAAASGIYKVSQRTRSGAAARSGRLRD